ncbi:hypothetical protein SAMN05443287_10519 [Micromonospora phaseoli]|uniref:Uncharacterized protein n=1 Tax=Micromonospora phaseoli TaxID=1144548 RepID=A0A1H6ZNB8_9ACTN|nr:hypothetical protein [Micromonospora phaseoli]PZV97283.1 hypothetical protein CLV64_106394 [Micromonospora phaseoli]GIJ80387.1 hypothetical protein Xph01_48190 [Micromonospora phaseoli]SEJ51090.1 hypothetical protein SAMN05443287_10519 [Micromonospora phaseoli]
MRSSGRSEFEGFAASFREFLTAQLRPAPTQGDGGAYLRQFRGGDSPGQAVISLPSESGKSMTLALIAQAMGVSKGFSVSVRALSRAGVHTEMLRYYVAAQETIGSGRLYVALRQALPPTDRALVADHSRADSWSPAGHATGCLLTVTDTFSVATDAVRAGGRIEMTVDRPREFYQAALWVAAQAVVVELGRVLYGLAMKARSRCGLPAAPPPTRPPGEIVRSRPRVPRGPTAAPVHRELFPAGRLLGMA